MRFRLAAPSCVIPDRVGPNCRALSSMVGEVALMLLETRGCLEYDELDLPADLPGLGLGYHAHLPLDLPWKDGPAAVGDVIFALEQKIAFLRPRGYVLHPPEPGDLSGLLRHRPGLSSKLWLENTREGDLCKLWDEIGALGLGVCLDVGHMVSYGQERVMDLPGFFERVRILHIYGGESERGHAGLDRLPDPNQLRDILLRLKGDETLVVEIFSLEELGRSLNLLQSWLLGWGLHHD
ncbi:MAG: cobamide remodeling phosphodiesterase CbiR [Desulfomicrobium apsheronum]|nr:cobamide remodeling phosphodiesterase CbiR [Desulfomicrobium apsheronum]